MDHVESEKLPSIDEKRSISGEVLGKTNMVYGKKCALLKRERKKLQVIVLKVCF